MPDIALRFHKDMLVFSAPIAAVLERQGVDTTHDLEYINLVEPEAVRDALRLESIAGAQCIVTNTFGITPAQLAHHGMEERAEEIAQTVLETVQSLKPQHIVVEIGPCGLPLDGANAASLNENRDQYARAARLFDKLTFDAFLLSGFTRLVEVKCALMGIGQVSGRPVFASVDVDDQGNLVGGGAPLEEAVALMQEFGAAAVGVRTPASVEQAASLVRRAVAASDVPVLAQLQVARRNPKQGKPTPENPYYCADVMIEAAAQLRAAGAQFLRAVGDATPAYTGALVAASDGFDVARSAQGE